MNESSMNESKGNNLSKIATGRHGLDIKECKCHKKEFKDENLLKAHEEGLNGKSWFTKYRKFFLYSIKHA